MRFLIGCTEICGLINTYSEQLKSKGHDVITIADKHQFYDSVYTYPSSNLGYIYFTRDKKPKVYHKLFFKGSEWLEKAIPDFRKLWILFSLLRKFDTYVYVWSGLVNEKYLFGILKFFNKKVVVLFLGDDVRHFSAFSQEFDMSYWIFPPEYASKPIQPGLVKLRYAEKYADLIYSVPDQMGLAVRPYTHLHIPIRTENFKFTNHLRRVPKVLHLPSEPFIKGTDRIMQVLGELKEEGLEFELIYKSKIPFSEVKTILEDVDVLVDEIICHGPGVLALEAMASGCAVATNFLEEHRKVYNPPICQIEYNNIKENLRKLISDFDYRQNLIEEGNKFVRTNNRAEKIVGDLLEDLNSKNNQQDYFPEFYKTKYKMAGNQKRLFQKLDTL